MTTFFVLNDFSNTNYGRKKDRKKRKRRLSIRNHILAGAIPTALIGVVPGSMVGATLGPGMALRGSLVGLTQGATIGALGGATVYGVRRHVNHTT